MTLCRLLFPVLALAASAAAQPDPSGIDFVTVTHPGNPAYTGFDPFGYTSGRGSVGYEYRLGRTEVTTAQWIEFFNTFTTQDYHREWLTRPNLWGAQVDPTYTGPGLRYRLRGDLPGAGDIAAYGITWRTAALYCNWLHNGKSSDPASLESGAYDASTFLDLPGNLFTDQATRSPGARYWIPSLDEWLKAAHWSPDNSANGGWYTYPNASDTPLVYGPPGQGQANAGFNLPGPAENYIPLGSYPATPSIWGTLDMAGCGSEWTEEIRQIGMTGMIRTFDGSYASSLGGLDVVYGVAGQYPGSTAGEFNLRIAAAIPAPSGVAMLATIAWVLGLPRRRTRCGVAHAPLPAHCSGIDPGF